MREKNTIESSAFYQHDVHFDNGNVTLAGVLKTPPNLGPHPAVVLLQGSGPSTRDYFGYFPPVREYFARHGIAVLCYDKPGVGESSGDWREQTYHDRAKEALAALRFLQTQSSINANQIGLWGHSQGGWIAPLAASLSQDIAFTIAVSGPGVSPGEQEIYSIEHQLRIEGYSESDVMQAMAYMDSIVDALRHGVSFEYAETTLIRPIRNRPWYHKFAIDNAMHWKHLTLVINHDPVPVLEHITCPLLAIFGERDPFLPVQKSVSVYEKALAQAKNCDVTIFVFSNADHGIQLQGTGLFAPGYIDTMTNWILDRVNVF